MLAGAVVPLGVLLGYALYERKTTFDEAVPTSVAAGVTLIPEGLILLTSLTYAVAALQMARRGVLAQQLAAPFSRRFFALAAPTPGMILISLAGAALALTALWLTDERYLPGRTD